MSFTRTFSYRLCWFHVSNVALETVQRVTSSQSFALETARRMTKWVLRVSYPRSLVMECLPEGGARRRGEKRERVFERSNLLQSSWCYSQETGHQSRPRSESFSQIFGNLTFVNLSKWNAAWKCIDCRRLQKFSLSQFTAKSQRRHHLSRRHPLTRDASLLSNNLSLSLSLDSTTRRKD